MRSGFSTLTLAYWIDSLVRVSRRDGKSHFDKIARRPLKPRASLTNRLTPEGMGVRLAYSWRETSFCLLHTKATTLPAVRHTQPMKYTSMPETGKQGLNRAQMITLLPLSSQRFQVF